MMNPFAALGVSPRDDDGAIRAAYLQKVKTFTPDADPERFATISDAYEKIKTADLRLKYILFNESAESVDPFGAFRDLFRLEESRTPPGLKELKEYLASCLK